MVFSVRYTLFLLYGVVSFLGLAHIAPAGSEVPDAEKKEAVYRMYSGYKKDFPAVDDVSVQQAMAWLNQGKVVFVDTRKPEEMAVSMLPGAVSKEDFLSHLDSYRDKIAVGYCTISYRSGVFARDMAARGISVLNLRGGILAWTLEGGEIYDKSGAAVRQVHVYGDKWDFAPAGYETIKFSPWEQMF